jgi:hypothetical protein
MNTRKLLHSACIAVLSTICLSADKLLAQSPEEGLHLMVNVEGNELRLPSQRGVFKPVTVNRAQVIPFMLEFPSNKAGLPLMVGALDGGEVNDGVSQEDAVVSASGKMEFSFQPGPGLGLYRLIVHLPTEQYILQFYLIDPGHP